MTSPVARLSAIQNAAAVQKAKSVERNAVLGGPISASVILACSKPPNRQIVLNSTINLKIGERTIFGIKHEIFRRIELIFLPVRARINCALPNEVVIDHLKGPIKC